MVITSEKTPNIKIARLIWIVYHFLICWSWAGPELLEDHNIWTKMSRSIYTFYKIYWSWSEINSLIQFQQPWPQVVWEGVGRLWYAGTTTAWINQEYKRFCRELRTRAAWKFETCKFRNQELEPEVTVNKVTKINLSLWNCIIIIWQLSQVNIMQPEVYPLGTYRLYISRERKSQQGASVGFHLFC